MSPDKHNHHVIIVPGFSASANRIKTIANFLEENGLIPHVFKYPAKEWTIDRAAMMLGVFVDTEIVEGRENIAVSFLSYELGSLVMRYYVSHYKLLPARRCLIIADPFHPSDKYRKKKIGWLGRYRYGTPLTQLAEGPHGFPTFCGIPPIPFGVIVTGTKTPKKGGVYNNQEIHDSLYVPRYMLKEAREVIYTPPTCKKALGVKPMLALATSFLKHGWFKGN